MRERWSVALVPLVAIAVAGGLSGPAVRADETCGTCHTDLIQAWSATGHARAFSAHPSYRDASCASCHGPGQAHAESGGEAAVANPAKADAKDANATCLNCHGKDPDQSHWQGSVHEGAGLACVSCHSVHKGHALKVARTLPGAGASSQKCLECHRDQIKGFGQRSRHPVREGKMECASCHNPHGSPGDSLVAAASVNDLCYSCHAEKRGPFLWEHSPVRENCLTCHTAHGSNHPSLMPARITQMCQACHQQGRHQSVAGLPTAVWLTNKQCVNCHTQIHGSNHPSGPLYQR